MLAVDRQHQPVEKAPPLRRSAHEKPVHRGRQPDHAKMIAEGGGRAHRFAVDAAAPAVRGGFGAWRIDAGAECRKAERAFDFGGHRPGAVALIVGDIVERRAAQSAARRQKRNRLDAIGLAGAVRAHQHHHIAPRLQARRPIIAEMRQAEAVNAGSGHGGGGSIFLPSPLVERVAPNVVRRRVRGYLTVRQASRECPPKRQKVVAARHCSSNAQSETPRPSGRPLVLRRAPRMRADCHRSR